MSFFTKMALAYFVANAWAIWWFWRGLRGVNPARWAVCLLMLCLAVAFPLWYKRPGATLPDIAIIRAGAAWMGVFPYLLLMVLLADASTLAGRFLGKSWAPTPRTCFAVLTLAACIGAAGWINAATPAVREYTLTIPVKGEAAEHLAGKTLIVGALSDIHLGRILTSSRLANALSLLAPYRPDVLFFLGDVLDDHDLLQPAPMLNALGQLNPRLGVWGILGNHEYISGKVNDSVAILQASGIRILREGWTVLDGAVLVVGRDDMRVSRGHLEDILARVPEQYRSLPLIVLDHQPRRLEEAEAAGAALQLSGHTHNGQIWPFNLLTDRLYENPLGLSARGNTRYIVSAGAGTWGPPMRTSSRPDVIAVGLHFVQEKDTARSGE